jgi:hypothetical protein
MDRRSGVASADGAVQSPGYAEEFSDAPEPGDSPTGKRQWNGGGGRWMVWPMRVLLWAALLVVAYRGVTAIAFDEVPAKDVGTSTTATSTTDGFPVALGEAYALQFAQVYLNFSPDQQNQRAQQLTQFIPSGASENDPEFGWNGSGTLRLQSANVAGIDVQNGNTAIVTVLATVNDVLMELGVPIYASGGGIVVSGEPAWLPAPSTIQPASQQQASPDVSAQNELQSQLQAFFKAYASGDTATLNRFLAPGATLTGLGGAVTFGSITQLFVPQGGATRDITVTVDWQLPDAGDAGLSATYDMSVVDQQSGKWYVREINASTQSVGSQ